MSKRTSKEVDEEFSSRECKLLERYVNGGGRMKYACACGKIAYSGIDKFVKNGKCDTCMDKLPIDGSSSRFEFIKNKLLEKGHTILDDHYVHSSHKISYICKCGNKTRTQFHDIMNLGKCKKCGHNRHTIEYVRSVFESSGCILLSKSYDHSNAKLRYICSCGNKSSIKFSHFKDGVRCAKCGVEKGVSQIRLSTEYVKKYLRDRGCTYLGNGHINSQIKFKYICECGNISYINLNKFKNGRRCKKCKRFSIGEDKIEKFLLKSGIIFKNEFRIDGCKNKLKLPFDFAIFDKSILIGLIEFDGEQHFKPLDFFGGIDGFNRLKRNDLIKSFYCFANRIPLLRIKYSKIDNIDEIVNDFIVKTRI